MHGLVDPAGSSFQGTPNIPCQTPTADDFDSSSCAEKEKKRKEKGDVGSLLSGEILEKSR